MYMQRSEAGVKSTAHSLGECGHFAHMTGLANQSTLAYTNFARCSAYLDGD